jgi:hypothetical protein
MLCPLDPEESYMLSQLCEGPWVQNPIYDSNVSLRLEQRGLAQQSLLGQLCPTAAGRLMAAST